MEQLPESMVCTAAQTSSTHSEGFGVFCIPGVISQHNPGLQLCSRAPHGESKWWSWIGQTGLTDWGGFGVEAPVMCSVCRNSSAPLHLPGLSVVPKPGGEPALAERKMGELGLLPGRRKSFAKIKALTARCLRWRSPVPGPAGSLLCCGFCLVPPVGGPERPPRRWQRSDGAEALPTQPPCPRHCPRGISGLFLHKGQVARQDHGGIATCGKVKPPWLVGRR